jgi:hypothetical protein
MAEFPVDPSLAKVLIYSKVGKNVIYIHNTSSGRAHISVNLGIQMHFGGPVDYIVAVCRKRLLLASRQT